jgi:hypothetical protein
MIQGGPTTMSKVIVTTQGETALQSLLKDAAQKF